jgi:diguanylate cyclase (GGDEF)-like protein/PAS domain S-box-containing protein
MDAERDGVDGTVERDLAQTLDLLSERVARYRVDDLVLTYCNRSWAAQYHADPSELIGLRIDTLLNSDEMQGLHSQLARLGPLNPYLSDPHPRQAALTPDRWTEWTDRYLPLATGAEVLAVGRDVTERHLAEQRLAASEAHFRLLAERSADLVWRLVADPKPRISYLSPSVEALTGWTAEAFGDDLAHLRSLLDEEGERVLDAALAGQQPPDRFDLRLRRPDGTWLILEMSAVRLPDGWQGIGRDVTQVRQLQDDLATLALRDPLTSLANRRLLDLLLDAALARAERAETPVVVTYVDLDGFKQVNDVHGHAAGDAVLVEVARRLSTTLRGTDLVARLGGDEFVAVHETDAARAATIAERISAALSPAYVLPSGVEVDCPASLGTADSGSHPTAPALLAAADAAMYEVKKARRVVRARAAPRERPTSRS